ncbi:MAG TPA: cytochrome P450 [Thermoanaerobaculia bacterium]|jgi:cytochrome P450|nr:cytochrome P450 [Thermoanaerobaculia bacterium]
MGFVMFKRELDAAFHRDPAGYLDRAFPAAGDAFWLPGRQLCVAEPAAARAVLINGDGLYEEHADFFHTRRGVFGPRSAQIQIGRSARMLLRSYLRAHAGELEESVRRLAPSSEWPDAGNRLLYQHLADALLSPDSPAPLRRTIDAVLERAVLAGARQRYSRLRRAVFRFQVERALVRAVEERRARSGGEPADLLDVVVQGAGPDALSSELAEVFLSFVFSIGGSVGFVLGWSVWLLGTNPRIDAPPAWIVLEALRLWPVAWMLGRQPTRAHEVAGVQVTPQDVVVVCPYLVHRHPRYWDDPESFRPERWAASPDLQAFIPFGWGPHTCVAGSLSIQLVEDVLKILLDGHELTVAPRDTRPSMGPALAPPRFTLGLHPHRP